MNKNSPQKLDVRSTCQLTLCTGSCVSIHIELGPSARNVLLFQPMLSPFFPVQKNVHADEHNRHTIVRIPTHNYVQNIVSLEISDIIVIFHIHV
jgi:hypothetical protein